MSNFVDMDKLDESSFNFVKHRALFKAVSFKTDNKVTIGPNAGSSDDTIDGTKNDESVQANANRAKCFLKLEDEENDKTDMMCNSKSIAVLDDLAKHEAQQAEHLFTSTADERLEYIQIASSSLNEKEQKPQFKDKEIIQNNSGYESLFKNREKFMDLYSFFLHTISHEQLNAYRQCELATAREIFGSFVNLLIKCKEGKVAQEDLEKSEILLKMMEQSCERATAELEKQQKEIENEKNQKLLKEQEQENMIIDEESSGYTELSEKANQYLKEVESQLESFLVDPCIKMFRMNCEKAITTQLNAISATSAHHLNDKFERITALLQGKSVVVISKTVNSGDHPLGILYCKYFLAHQVVHQGEMVVSNHLETAFALASFALAVWTLYPDFGLLLMARFYRTCPYLIPTYEPNESKQDYNKRIGFLYNINGEKECIEKLLYRQRGVVKLYAAMIVSPMKRSFRHLPSPLSEAEGWRWIATFCQIQPRALISATILLDMLEVTSHALHSAYRNQYRKLLHYIYTYYVPEIEKVTPDGDKGPVRRLTSFLENFVNRESVPPKGVLAADFW